MELLVKQLHPHFVGEITGIDLSRPLDAETIKSIKGAINQYAVLVFRNQVIDDEQQIAFSEHFGILETVVAHKLSKGIGHRLDPRVSDISNVDSQNQIRARDDQRRVNALADRLWHTDSSFKPVIARYSILSARVIPAKGGETHYADMRAAYDALSPDLAEKVNDLTVVHNLLHSRETILGVDNFTEEQRKQFPPVQHPLVQVLPETGRASLYLASHASHIADWPVPEGRVLLSELTEHATKPEFIYVHHWQEGDVVMWDNRSTMHRARPFESLTERREMRRTTVSDGIPA